ncbi:MAG: thioredoxin family protein [Campylobacterales bacterium]
MKKIVFLFWASAALLWSASIPLEELLAKAKAENKVALVFVETDFCPWCKRMKESTFTNVKVKAKLENELVVGYYNKDRDALPSHLGARQVPTIHLVDGDGKILFTVVGYVPPGPFLKHIQGAQEDLAERQNGR